MIPRIDVSALFGPPGPARDAVDAAILDAAGNAGFMTIAARPGLLPLGVSVRDRLTRIFSLPEAATRTLWRQKFAPENPNIYRGWFPLQSDLPSYKRGIDMGPDLVRPRSRSDDPLLEPTPLPAEGALPGWRADAAAYFSAMEALGAMMMRAIARGLGLPETQFNVAFTDGNSTLRLLHYPVPEIDPGSPRRWLDHGGVRRFLLGGEHVDSGFITLLAQDGTGGLQARAPDGSWHDVPPEADTLAVNFGGILERWTGGRMRATEHRVLGPGQDRYSIPFFYEPAVDARIAPLPLPGMADFASFAYGDHLWAAMARFTEFRGMESLRRPRAA